MNHAAFVTPILLDSAAIDSLTDVLSPICAPLPAPCFYLKIINVSNYAVYISFDGIEENDYIPADDTVNLKFDTVFNRQIMVYPTWPEGQKIYASIVNWPFGKLPPSGSIFVTAFTSFTEKGT
jgi:hypothetical protein